ncbi:MAG: rhodanese-like domain-containing protein [Gammaproteobacteria bacterium]|nr:rhodanese-like domain-containing protein [Gammaproteobacteria bacterium]
MIISPELWSKLLEFSHQHLPLVAGFFAVLGALLFSFTRGAGGNSVSCARAVQMLNHENALPLDVRPEKSFRAGHLINALAFGAADPAASASRLSKYKDRPLIIYCENGSACARPVRDLKAAGFTKLFTLQGGLAGWRNDNLPLHTLKEKGAKRL